MPVMDELKAFFTPVSQDEARQILKDSIGPSQVRLQLVFREAGLALSDVEDRWPTVRADPIVMRQLFMLARQCGMRSLKDHEELWPYRDILQ